MSNATAASSAVDLEWILPPIALACLSTYFAIYFWILYTKPLKLNLGLKMLVRKVGCGLPVAAMCVSDR